MKEENSEGQCHTSGLIACQRCRLRKIRCDRRLPRCTSCERAKCACLTTDPTSGKTMPRSYIIHLESRVKELEKELSTMKGVTTLQSDEQTSTYWGGTTGLSFWHTLSSMMRNDLEKDGQEAPCFKSEGSGPLTVPVTEEVHTSTPKFILPPKDEVETLMKKYFEVNNAQIPLIHRESFITAYYEPLYGPLSPNLNIASDYTELNLPRRFAGEPPIGTFYSKYKGEDINQIHISDPKIRRALYFLLQLIAIGKTFDIENPEISTGYHQQAMRYYTDTITTRDRGVALKGVIMLGIYSLARPAFPGVWHVSGMAMRLCIELGLHKEDGVAWNSCNQLMRDEARRLFWSTYILDRQVSVFLGRPAALPENYIKVKKFCLADDSLIQPDTDLAQLPTWPSYKNVSIHVINLMRLQYEIKHNFYDRVDVQEMPNAKVIEKARALGAELKAWYKHIPKDPRILNFDFRSYYFEVTYHVTRLLLIRGATFADEPLEEQLWPLVETGMAVMRGYGILWENRMLNFSWAAVNNMFIAATASLYAIWRLFPTGKLQIESIDEIEKLMDCCMKILHVLKKVCNVATYSYESLEAMKKVVFNLIRSNRGRSPTSLQIQFQGWPLGDRVGGERPGFTEFAEADDVSKVDVPKGERASVPPENSYLENDANMMPEFFLPRTTNTPYSMTDYMSGLPQQLSQWESFVSQPDFLLDIYPE